MHVNEDPTLSQSSSPWLAIMGQRRKALLDLPCLPDLGGGGTGAIPGLIHRAPSLPDPGRGSEDLQLHLHHHLRLGVSFQTRGLWLPSVLPGQVTETGRGQVTEHGGGGMWEDLGPEDLS